MDEHGYLRDLREKMEKALSNQFFASLSLQSVVIFFLVLYAGQTVLLKCCYDIYMRRKGRLTKLS